MKIAIVCGAGMVSGKEIMALELGEGLRDRGHSIHYVTSLWGDGKFGQRLEEARFDKTRMRLGFISATLTLDCLWMTADQLARVPGLWFDYRRFLRESNPVQVVHTNWHHLLVLFPFLNARRDWFWLHEVVPDKPQYRRVFGALDKRLRGWIPVSHAVKASLVQIGIPESHIHVVHNGLKDPAAGAPARTVSDGMVRIGIAGQITPGKGHRELFRAFCRLAGKGAELELHVFGAGTEAFQQELRQLVADAGFSQRVRWHGYVRERQEIYGNMDICVVPSLTPDPLPTTAIEAAFFGLPTIVTRCGGLPEIVEHGTSGLIIEIGDVDQLTTALERLVKDPEGRAMMGLAARSRVLAKFERKRFISEFDTLLCGGNVTACHGS